MRKLFVLSVAAAAALWIVAVRSASDTSVDALLHQAAAGSWRSDAHKARDQYRHPIETLEFFGLQPDMTVVELAPGGGWYTEILAPVLREHGQLIDAAVPPKGDSESDGTVKYLAKLKAIGESDRMTLKFVKPKQ